MMPFLDPREIETLNAAMLSRVLMVSHCLNENGTPPTFELYTLKMAADLQQLTAVFVENAIDPDRFLDGGWLDADS